MASAFTDPYPCATAHLVPLGCRHGVVSPRRFVNLLHVGPTYSPTSLRRFIVHSSPIPPAAPVVPTAFLATESSVKVIDGKSVAEQIKDEIRVDVSRMKEAIGLTPGLAVIVVGDREDSLTYVSSKKKCSKYVGIYSLEVQLPGSSTEQEVIQLPSPLHMNVENVLNSIRIEKDVDGFHPLNISCLAMRGREPLFIPCTPKGCIELLHKYDVPIEGKRAVVIGRSNIVGLPATLLLQREDATISIVHSKTNNPEEITKQADIIVSAVVKPNMVRGSWIKPGAVIIGDGFNQVDVVEWLEMFVMKKPVKMPQP